MQTGPQRDFWTEVRRTQHKGSIVVNNVDGISGDAGICEHFGNQYKELYNSVSYNADDMSLLFRDLDRAVSDTCMAGNCYCDHNITSTDVQKAISRLKRGKSDSKDGLSSDHFINSCGQLSVHIALFLSMGLRHSFVPPIMRNSVLIPIPKNARKSLYRSENYRSIAISSLIGKILDNIVLVKHEHILCNSELQFGFRQKHSTTQCTFVLDEIIDFYKQENTPTFVCLLDASKAFDRVNYVRLFRLLLERNFCPLTAKLLLFSYINQSMCVRWSCLKSTPFSCTNGVKQGAVLSPVLFCVYVDKLMSLLKQSNVGCYLGRRFAGALSYADDITLVAPSVNAIRRLLVICENFANSYDVLFNSAKSVSLVFGNTPAVNTDLYLHGKMIPKSTSAIHLGVHIGLGSQSDNISKAKRDLCIRVNSLLSNFSFCSYDVLCRLFTTYCNSYYGSPLWNLSQIDEIHVTWRKCIRRILHLPVRTHSRYIPYLIKTSSLHVQLYKRFFNFIVDAYMSPNPLVRYCSRLASMSQTNVAENLRTLFASANTNTELFFNSPECFDFFCFT